METIKATFSAYLGDEEIEEEVEISVPKDMSQEDRIDFLNKELEEWILENIQSLWSAKLD